MSNYISGPLIWRIGWPVSECIFIWLSFKVPRWAWCLVYIFCGGTYIGDPGKGYETWPNGASFYFFFSFIFFEFFVVASFESLLWELSIEIGAGSLTVTSGFWDLFLFQTCSLPSIIFWILCLLRQFTIFWTNGP